MVRRVVCYYVTVIAEEVDVIVRVMGVVVKTYLPGRTGQGGTRFDTKVVHVSILIHNSSYERRSRSSIHGQSVSAGAGADSRCGQIRQGCKCRPRLTPSLAA